MNLYYRMKFKNSQIFKLTSRFTDEVFFGYTTRSLQYTLTKMKKFIKENIDFNQLNTREDKYYSSFRLLRYVDVKIEQVEAFPCESYEEINNELLSVINVNKVNTVKVVNNCQEYGIDLDNQYFL